MDDEKKWFRPLSERMDIPEEVIHAAEYVGLDNPRQRHWYQCDFWPFGNACVAVHGGPIGTQNLYNGVAVAMTGNISISWHPVGDNLYTCDYCVGQHKTTKNIVWAKRSNRTREQKRSLNCIQTTELHPNA